MQRSIKIGLALGSGGARGAAHIGIIKGLKDLGIHPHCICGSSIGGLIAGAYVFNKIDEVETWLTSFDRKTLLRAFDFRLGKGGLIKGDRIIKILEAMSLDIPIERSPIPFGIVATDLYSGKEIWLRQGNFLQAIKASCAIPGLVAPVMLNERWLFDGGVINPIPVSLCKSLGADIIIAVNLNVSTMSKRLHTLSEQDNKKRELQNPLNQLMSRFKRNKNKDFIDPPHYFDVIGSTLDIMQDQITRSRMIGEPPDCLLTPRLAGFGTFQFDRSKEAIHEGYQCVMRRKEELLSLFLTDKKKLAEMASTTS